MQRREFLIGIGALAPLAVAGQARAANKKLVRLYNGRDLIGWHAKDGKLEVWKANGPILTCTGGGGGWLTTDHEYGDFELHVDYRIVSPAGNSGVGLRYPAEGDPAHEGMEIQILDDGAPPYRDLTPAQYTGGIYYQVAPKAHPAKPVGEWNRYVIRCYGPHVVISLNGVEIQNTSLDQETHGLGGHKPLSERPRRGFVGLQSHTGVVEFRNIEIREL